MSGNAGGNAGGVILCSLSEGTIPRVLMRGSHCRLASMLYLLSWQGPCIDPYTFSTLSPQDSSVDRQDCRKRWFHSLDPSVRKGKWSPNEDDALRKLYSELGPQWKEIGKCQVTIRTAAGYEYPSHVPRQLLQLRSGRRKRALGLFGVLVYHLPCLPRRLQVTFRTLRKPRNAATTPCAHDSQPFPGISSLRSLEAPRPFTPYSVCAVH